MARMIERLPVQKCAGGLRVFGRQYMCCQKAVLKVRPGAMGGAVSAPDLRLRAGRIRSFGLLAGRLTK